MTTPVRGLMTTLIMYVRVDDTDNATDDDTDTVSYDNIDTVSEDDTDKATVDNTVSVRDNDT